MGVSVEWVTGIIRAGENRNQLEDDFEFCCTVLKHNDHVILKGAAGVMPKHLRSDLKKLFKELGIKTAEWQINTENTATGGDKI